MSAVSIEQRIRNAAVANSQLLALLRSMPGAPFRWYLDRLAQNSEFPAVVTMTVSNPGVYVGAGRLPTSTARVQFTIWGGQYTAGAQAREDVTAALLAFFDTLNLVGSINSAPQPCYVRDRRNAQYFQTDTTIYQKIIDAMIFYDDTLT